MLMKPKKEGTVYMAAQDRMTEMEDQNGAQQDVDQYTVAAEEVLAAVERRDVQALKEALKSFMEMCSSEEVG